MKRATPPGAHQPLRYIDLFCGIGGFRLGVESVGHERHMPLQCVFSSDINPKCQDAYEANFGHRPVGDITEVHENNVPAHDLLLAGFPCQPFSIMGEKKGFADTRGTLFFDIARILKAQRPAAFILENVRLLTRHDNGRTLRVILDALADLGYSADYKVLNALQFGLPHKRERIFIVGFRDQPALARFQWPAPGAPMKPLADVLETVVDQKHFASEHIRKARLGRLKREVTSPMIWHENKSGHVTPRPYSHALRAGASYNYLLVDGIRRLTPREMLRLQGFPDSYKIVCKDQATRSQAGNSVPVNLVRAVAEKVFEAVGWIAPLPPAEALRSGALLQAEMPLRS